MEAKKKSEFEKVKDLTRHEEKYFEELLQIEDLLEENPTESYKQRYNNIRDVTMMMSMDPRSVGMVGMLLNTIFTVSDADYLASQKEKQLDVILKKFKGLQLLEKALLVPATDLVRYSSSTICGKITYLSILQGDSLCVIDDFIGHEFFCNHVLQRSWYYLLNKKKITFDKLQESLLKNQYNGIALSIDQLRNQLYECIAKIAFTNKLNYTQKKNVLQMLKNAFGFNSDQELIELYNSDITDTSRKRVNFETRVIQSLIKRFTFGKSYFLEKIMNVAQRGFTLRFFIKKQYMQSDFYNRKGDPSIGKKYQQFKSALEFIAKEFKKCTLQQADFGVSFLEAFDQLFPNSFIKEMEQDPMKRQKILLSYVLTVELLIKENLIDDQHFKTSLIMMTIYVLKLGIEYKETVEITIFSMQLLLNAIGLQQSLPFINKFICLAIKAFLKFPDRVKIKKYTSKIINFYVKDKQRYTSSQYKDLQFILLNKIKENSAFHDSISCITSVLYQKPEEIAESLKSIVDQLRNGNEDIRLLNTTYILELLEQQDQDEIRRVLVQPDILKVVYQGILEMPQNYKTENSRKLSITCAKVIAAIGLCQPFVNDPLTLKATNQTTVIIGKDCEYGKSFDEKNPNIIKSDYYNPLTNLKYKNQDSNEDNTLEVLAVQSLRDLYIEKRNACSFAKHLLAKLKSMTSISDGKPQKYYYTLFMLDKFITLMTKDELRDQQLIEDHAKKIQQQDHIFKTMHKFIGKDIEAAKIQEFPHVVNDCRILRFLCLHLINKIQNKQWQEIFEACIPALNQSHKVVELLLPYIVYYALRFNQSDQNLPDNLGKLFNNIFDSQFSSQIIPVLKVQDFLKICYNQDKRMFKKFIEDQTKFKYVEKLYQLEFDSSKTKDQNIITFIKVIEGNEEIKTSFFTVRKIKSLLNVVDKIKKIKAAKLVKAFQRCIYYFEEHYRNPTNNGNMQNKGFLEVLSPEDTIEIVNLHKQLNPEDFSYGLFNSILQSPQKKRYLYQDVSMEEAYQQIQKPFVTNDKDLQKKLDSMLSKTSIIQHWKEGKWEKIQEWAQEIDIYDIKEDAILLTREVDKPIEKFEMVLAIFIAEYQKGLKCLLQSDDTFENKGYLQSLEKINYFFGQLYGEFILSLEGMKGEIAYYYKLFLHVIYEMESAVHFLKDILFSEKEKITEILKREVNKEKRRFEKVYYEFDMNIHFEKLLSWFEERSQLIQNSTESLKLIYFARRMIFSLYDRENEYSYYLMRIAKIYRKTSDDVLQINSFFKECESMESKIIDFEFEYAKYIMKTKNAHEAYQYLISKHEIIKEKCDKMYKATKFLWMPQKIYEKSILLSIDLQIKLDPLNPSIIQKFDELLKQVNKMVWEKPAFKFAQYLDELDTKKQLGLTSSLSLDAQALQKRQIQKIFYFVTSLKFGYKYIWQSFPRALELWFDFNERDNDTEKINKFIAAELMKLETFKLASVLQILLSRYGHPSQKVREIIILVLSKIAIEYPSHCAWWILHFLHFDQDSQQPLAIRNRQQAQRIQAISRAEFARSLLGKIIAQDDNAEKIILSGEKIFQELKRLSEKTPPSPQATTMEIPQALQKIQVVTNLVMPIEENLSPQIPPQNWQMNFTQSALACTTSAITAMNSRNADISILYGMREQIMSDGAEINANQTFQKFPAYKSNPVMISGFVTQATIMLSKEKPKKIGIIGSDRQVYNFLLKCDKHGDLRKEQRFIDFAVLCNKMLENDSESRKRNLKLRTNAIVPLSRNTGLIEWIQNTSTLKTVVGDYWKKNNIKGEMQDIKKRANEEKAGDTHTEIWGKVKHDIKPVLGIWMQDHFPSPELWYEAKINFIRSTAIWSMIGYVIGLGDRHGDNILIHMHTGEVTHVDFDCIFEKGAKLKIPEIVPFRLTQNIMDAFGIFKEKGTFYRTCEVVQRVLRKNSKNIVSFLESFVHDPLIESTNNIKVEINHALEVVKQKLHGQIKGEHGGSLIIEEQVENVIMQAINDDSLSKMYIGWMPWL